MSFENDLPPDDLETEDEADILDELSRIIDWRLREQPGTEETAAGAGGAPTTDEAHVQPDRPGQRPATEGQAAEGSAAADSGTAKTAEDEGEEDLVNDELRRLRARMRADEEAWARQDAPARAGRLEGNEGLGEPAPDRPGTPHGALSEGLRVLFERPREQTRPPGVAEPEAAPPGTAPPGTAEPSEDEPTGAPLRAQESPRRGPHFERTGSESPYFLRFRQAVTAGRAPLETGITRLDEVLQGGLASGLSVVSARPPATGRAFALNLLWQAISQERHALCYTLAGGAQALWQDLIVMLSYLTEDDPLTAGDLGRSERARAELTRVQRLDSVLGRTFLPFVTVAETIPAGPHPLTTFLRTLERQVASGVDLLVLDDLAQLEALLGLARYRERAALLAELEALLREHELPGLLLTYPGWSGRRSAEDGLEHLGSVLLRLRSVPESRLPDTSNVRLQVMKQPGPGRPGEQVQLLLDRSSGLLAEAPER
jgi:hypothetical protein